MAHLYLFISYILLIVSPSLSIPAEQTGSLKNLSNSTPKATNESQATIASVKCAEKFDCQTCMDVGCIWTVCQTEGSCQEEETEFCTPQDCVNTSTTTVAPTEPPTTEAPTEAPTEPPTTEAPTKPPPTEAPTTAPPTVPPTTAAPTQPPTEAPTTAVPTDPPTEAPTDAPTTVPTTTSAPPPTPEPRHFDPASFIGGMVFAVAIIAVIYAAWRFWKHRNSRNYHTL